MSVKPPEVLSSPYEIFHALKPTYPELEATAFVDEKAVVKMQVKLHGDSSLSFVLERAVVKKKFLDGIDHHSMKSFLLSEAKLKTDKFSIQQPLTNWKFFVAQIAYEKAGQKCGDALINFLLDPADQSTVSQLGFAPAQVDEDPTASDLNFFRGILKRLDGCDESAKARAIATFKSKYPSIARVVFILKYLQNPMESNEAASLGLAPEQIDGNPKENDFDFFRGILKRLNGYEEPAKTAAISTFKAKYANISKLLGTRLASQQQQDGLQAMENRKYEAIRESLSQRVYGQEFAVEKVASSIISQENHPGNDVLLFVGPTGVGKTELAKAASDVKSKKLIFSSMNQCQNATDVTKFFGAATGFVGSSDKPQFVKELERFHPTKIGMEGAKEVFEVTGVVLLFDEFEKAHSNVKQSLLTLFDEGQCEIHYTHTAGNYNNATNHRNVALKYIFKRCIFICTSNLYSDELVDLHKTGKNPTEIVKGFRELNATCPTSSSFSPELLGRFKAIIPFALIPKGPIYQGLLKSKLALFISELQAELRCKLIDIEDEAEFLRILEDRLYDDGKDMRAVKRFFDQEIKPVIYKNKAAIGKFTDKKFTFASLQGKFSIKVAIFEEVLQEYHSISAPLPLT